MDHLKKVITSEQFQQLNDDILRGMDISKKEYCNTDHHKLQKAKDQLHALLTNIMMGDIEYILDKSINESKKEMAKLRKARSQLYNQKKITSSKKANKDRLVHILETAKRLLVDTLQGELWNQIESADARDKVREDTIRQLIQFLRENELHVPRSEDWTEPAISISVLQSLAKQTQDNLQTVCGLINKASKASKEEEHATLELNNCKETEYKDSQQTFTRRIADLDEAYIALVDLELDHDNIRKE